MQYPLLTIVLFTCLACAGTPDTPATPMGPAETRAVELALDDWHLAAADADGEAYFGGMSDDAVFLGTDASERWTKAEFQAFAEPYFKPGGGWTYVASERHVAFSGDGQLAWIDEKLANASYGELRGTGVLRRESGRWKIVHYSMSFPLPNDVTRDVVELVRTHLRAEQ